MSISATRLPLASNTQGWRFGEGLLSLSAQRGVALNVLLLATAWGPRHGGINAFNRGVAVGLVRALSGRGRVFCGVPECDGDSIANALGHGVSLVPIGRIPVHEIDVDAWVASIKGALDGDVRIDVFVGHDVITGDAANAAARALGGKSAFIHHMHYEDYLGSAVARR